MKKYLGFKLFCAFYSLCLLAFLIQIIDISICISKNIPQSRIMRNTPANTETLVVLCIFFLLPLLFFFFINRVHKSVYRKKTIEIQYGYYEDVFLGEEFNIYTQERLN